MEGLTWSTRRASRQDPRPDVAVERTDPSPRTKTKTESPPGGVTSRPITRPVDFSLCAPSGRPRCRPPASVGWACAWTWAMAQAPAQPQMTARWEPEAPQAPHLARATSIAARVSRPPLRGTVAFIAFRDELTCAIAITPRDYPPRFILPLRRQHFRNPSFNSGAASQAQCGAG